MTPSTNALLPVGNQAGFCKAYLAQLGSETAIAVCGTCYWEPAQHAATGRNTNFAWRLALSNPSAWLAQARAHVGAWSSATRQQLHGLAWQPRQWVAAIQSSSLRELAGRWKGRLGAVLGPKPQGAGQVQLVAYRPGAGNLAAWWAQHHK